VKNTQIFGLLWLVSCLANEFDARASEDCSTLFSQIENAGTTKAGDARSLAYEAGKSTALYLREVARTYGLRLLLKQAKEGPVKFLSDYQKPAGFWATMGSKINLPQVAVRKITYKISGAEKTAHPFTYSYEKLVDAPVKYVSQKIFHSEKGTITTLPVAFTASAIVGQTAYTETTRLLNEQRHKNIRQGVENDKEEWNNLLAFSYLYSDIYDLVKAKVFTPEMGRLAAYNRQQGASETRHNSLANLFEFLKSAFFEAQESEASTALLATPYFQDIKEISEGEINSKGFAGNTETFSADPTPVIRKLVEEKRKYLLNSLTVDQLFTLSPMNWIESPHLEKIFSFEYFNPEYSRTETKIDSYYLAIKKRLAQGSIDPNVAKFLLQEDLSWQYEFRKRELLGQTFLKVNARGEYTSEELTLKDIRIQSLREKDLVNSRLEILQHP
jgi:hypothetical protein